MPKDYDKFFVEKVLNQNVLCENCEDAVCTSIGNTAYRVKEGVKRATIDDCSSEGERPSRAIWEKIVGTSIRIKEIAVCLMFIVSAYAVYNMHMSAIYLAKEIDLQIQKEKAYSQINEIHNASIQEK